jgi:hypothetical protein
MNTAAAIVCKSFLQKCPQEKRARLFHFLSEDKQEFLHELPSAFFHNPADGFSSIETELSRIHFSWFDPIFRTFSENEVRLFLSALDSQQAKGLKKLLLFSNHAIELKPSARPFFEQTLWGKIANQEILPIECLGESPLNALLELEPPALMNLIDYLGIHDLAIEVKQIIETARLKQIYAALSADELAYLKTLQQRKEPLAFKRMELQTWDGKKSTLRTLLRQRGANRLAKALYQKEKSLLWRVSHKLEMEVGEQIMRLATPLEHARAQEILINQVTELLATLRTSP